MTATECRERIIDAARVAINTPPYGYMQTGSFEGRAGNLASNAFVLGLLTAAGMCREEPS